MVLADYPRTARAGGKREKKIRKDKKNEKKGGKRERRNKLLPVEVSNGADEAAITKIPETH